jgi:hypothetical protein
LGQKVDSCAQVVRGPIGHFFSTTKSTICIRTFATLDNVRLLQGRLQEDKRWPVLSDPVSVLVSNLDVLAVSIVKIYAVFR